MSKASKVSHFHSTTYSAHRGGVAHATLGRPMIPAAPAPGTVGAMTPKIPSRGVSSNMCQSFKNSSETLWQFANRVAPGPGGKTTKLNEIANWKIMLGGRLETGITLKEAALAIKGGTPMGSGNPAWWNATAAEMTKGASYLLPIQEPQIQAAYDYWGQKYILAACPSGGYSSFALRQQMKTGVMGAEGTDEADPTRPGVVGAISDSTSLTSKDRWVASCVGESVNYGYAKYTSKCNKPGSVGSMSLFSWDDGQIRAIFIYNGMDSQQIRNMFLPFGGDSFYNGPDLSKKFRIIEGTPWSEWKMIGVPMSVAMAFAKNYGIPTNFKQENVDTNTQIVTGTSPCPPNQHRNASNTACECDQGYTKNAAGSCVAMDYYGKDITPPVKAACPRGWVRNAQGKCVKLLSTAPQTQHRKNVFQQPFDRPGKIHGDLIDGTVGDFIDDAGDWVSTVVQESQNAFYNPDGRSGYTPPSANPGDNQTAAEQCANLGPGWSWSADRNDCVNFQKEAQACVDAGNTWDDVAGQCRSNNCPPGSHSNPDIPGCIPDKIPCGANSFQSGDKCLCEKGFEFKDMVSLDCVPIGQGWQSAIKKCGPGTHNDPNVGGCVCDQGYIVDPNRTTADTLVCGKAECGANSVLGPDGCRCKPGYDWVDPANMDNLDCKKVGGPGTGPVAPVAPKCGPGTHVDSATNTCVVDETKQGEGPAKEEDNTWKWVAGIAAAAVVVGGGTYLAMKKDKKGKKSALQAKLSSYSTQTDVS